MVLSRGSACGIYFRHACTYIRKCRSRLGMSRCHTYVSFLPANVEFSLEDGAGTSARGTSGAWIGKPQTVPLLQHLSLDPFPVLVCRWYDGPSWSRHLSSTLTQPLAPSWWVGKFLTNRHYFARNETQMVYLFKQNCGFTNTENEKHRV